LKKLSLGKVIVTKRAYEKFEMDSILHCLGMHQRKNWGDASPQSIIDWNNMDIKTKVMSIHKVDTESCYIYTDLIKQQTEVFVREDY